MKTKVRALKKLYFSNNNIVQPNEYVEVDNELLQKFLKWKAVEVRENVESMPYNAESEDVEKERPDIVEVVKKIDTIKNKSELISYGNSLGIEELTMEMTKEDIKAAIINGMEDNNDV